MTGQSSNLYLLFHIVLLLLVATYLLYSATDSGCVHWFQGGFEILLYTCSSPHSLGCLNEVFGCTDDLGIPTERLN